MKRNDNIKEKILNEPSYWIEGINGFLYDAIVSYMEENGLNRTQLADYLGVSKGRVSQILNDGDINFSIAKIIEIALKIDKYPDFKLQDKKEYLEHSHKSGDVVNMIMDYDSYLFSETILIEKISLNENPIVSLRSYTIENQLTYCE
ncbi:helix-turn-helix protein [Marinilabilia salmonicolor]|jgi:predicted XRE-type DNA-binding protein|uniref:helix-turn-helix transcriptional regulator n=1 Tax=Marinilabilia salmonicolor TaxID=989 RepID=UPI000D04A466|nr:helix-turn-helix transcriptional regulator [Marinilabilia salmonicolor]PRY98212.1 helix-turn-helix protein [Marinilabilia salmonicolor]